jgi:hypothetical protein
LKNTGLDNVNRKLHAISAAEEDGDENLVMFFSVDSKAGFHMEARSETPGLTLNRIPTLQLVILLYDVY